LSLKIRRARVHRPGAPAETVDSVAVEEPLEIRVEGETVAITMRTPGDDLDLTAGFLYTEGVIDGPDDLHAMAHVDDPASPRGNTVDVVLAAGVPAARAQGARRSFFASSACGLCSAEIIDRILRDVPTLARTISPDPELLLALPRRIRARQEVFEATGGLHAAALFDASGELESLREDIGRHNAVDKVIGARLRADRTPCDDAMLFISGRAGFEIIQKAAVARIGLVAAVGAPSSLSVALADRIGMTLIGFLRDGRYNRYAGLID